MNFLKCCNAFMERHVRQWAFMQFMHMLPTRSIKQIVMRIQITSLIIFIAFLNVAANVNGQNVTIKAKNASLTSVFNEIKKQTGYLFWYEDDLIKNIKGVDINVNNATLAQAMDASIKGQALEYSINERTIMVREKKPSLINPLMQSFKSLNINGRVVDEKGQPLIRATIKVKQLGKQTSTNSNGEFYLDNVPDDAIIEISFIGYVTKEFRAQSRMSITLVAQSENLQEVQINAGYYTVTNRERTGSIARLDSKQMGEQPMNNPLMAIQGRLTGVQVTQQTGIPGGGFNILIRGRSSISSGTEPLFLVDGIVFPNTKISGASSSAIVVGANPLSAIDPNDIESIEILKDADATAIYGSRGANGVVLITTKRNKTGASNISTSINTGYNEVARKIEMLNTTQYVEMRNEALKNDGLSIINTDYDLNGAWDQSVNRDWQKYLIGNKAFVTNASISSSGGNEKSNYLLSGNYYSEGSVFKGNSNYDRFGLHVNINMGAPLSRLTAQFTGNYSHIKSNLIRSDLTRFIVLPPNFPDPFDQNGNLNFQNNTVTNNPMSDIYRLNQSGTDTFTANLVLNYKILNDLTLKIAGGYTMLKRDELLKSPASVLSPTLAEYNAPTGRNANYSNNYNNNLLLEPQLTYHATLGKGTLDALVGMSLQDNNSQLFTVAGTGYSSDELLSSVSSAGTLTSREDKFVKYRYIAGFARLNYKFADKYIINLTGRRDGSTRFGADKQFAFFGAVGAAWIFSEEKVFKSALPFINFGKLRGSFGVTGNDQITDYQFLQLWTNGSGTYQGNATLNPSRLGNPDFSWETNKKLEAALELGLLNNRLQVQAAYYRNRSSNQLVIMNLPLSVGYVGLTANLPALVQNTGVELEANWKIINGSDFSWTSGFNLTIPRNKLVKYPGIETSVNASSYTVGQPLTIKKVYNTSLNPITGIYEFEDYNKNGAKDAGDRYINKFNGQYYYGGIQNMMSYKGFSLSFLLSYTKQNGNNYMSTTSSPGYWDPRNPTNLPVYVLDRWQKTGDQTMTQKFSTTATSFLSYLDAAGDGGLSITDASFIRLRSVNATYELPRSWLSLVKIKSASLTLQGQNVFTITNFKGLDPETQSVFNLPPLRSWMLGLRINL